MVENSRNMIMAVLLSALVLFGGTLLSEKFFPQPKAPPVAAQKQADQPAAASDEAAPAVKPQDRDTVLASTQRVAIETPALKGSINLAGARIDDLVLVKYPLTVKKDSPPVRLLSPEGSADAYYARIGWAPVEGLSVPGPYTVWQADGVKLSPKTPVTLSWDNGQGLLFQMRYKVDENYLFSVDQIVTNRSTGSVALRTKGVVNRAKSTTKPGTLLIPGRDQDSKTTQVGPMGVMNGSANYDVDYDDLDEKGSISDGLSSKGGWLGFSESYWLTALVPANNVQFSGKFAAVSNGTYQAEYLSDAMNLAAGATSTSSAKLFAGAKELRLLDTYEAAGIPLFSHAIDWGWFRVLERPIFFLLDWLFKLVGNFGIAIIMLTFIVRGLMFPVAQKQFASMARMRAIQPKMKELQEKFKDDKPRQQQEVMALYQKEKINPLGGCLPIFIQMPIFYGLFKVLNLSIEMRHQPFMLWVHDLSAPDPATVLNLFGFLPFHPSGFLAIGVLPILLGITMYLQFKLNPAPMDPAQQQVFALMPWFMMFMMAPFAAGLQLYWTVSNLLTIAQQKWLYSRHPALAEPAKK